MARCTAFFGWLLLGLGSGQLSAADAQGAEPHEEPPSAELLMYLAEFGDDSGQVDDPIAVERAMRKKPGEPGEPGLTANPTEPMEPTLEAPEQ